MTTAATASTPAPVQPRSRRTPLKIVHIITRFIRGGADENTLLTCNGQAQLGHHVTLIHGGEFHPLMLARLDPRVGRLELKSLQRELHPFRDAACFLDLLAAFKRLAPDLVHTHESKAGVLGRLAARACGVPCIVHGVHILAYLNVGVVKGLIYRGAEWCASHVTDVYIDVSDGMRAACLSAGLGSPDRHVVVPSGMDIGAYRDARRAGLSAEAARFGLTPSDPLFILTAAALEPRKRIVEFLDVFAEIAQANEQACLLIAGEGMDRERVDARIKALGLEGRAVCIGYRPDLAAWIAEADICVHCAEREGLPRVLVQYVAGRKPVVAANLPGLEQLVRHESNGYLTDLADLGAMKAPLLELLRDSSLRARMGLASAQVDVSDWSLESMVDRTEEAYEIALARRSA